MGLHRDHAANVQDERRRSQRLDQAHVGAHRQPLAEQRHRSVDALELQAPRLNGAGWTLPNKAEAAEAFRTRIDQVALAPNEAELAIVLRGDLAAILRLAANKKNPAVLSEAGVLGALLSQVSSVAATRNTRSRRNGSGNAKTSAAEALEVSQESLVAGAGFEPAAFRL